LRFYQTEVRLVRVLEPVRRQDYLLLVLGPSSDTYRYSLCFMFDHIILSMFGLESFVKGAIHVKYECVEYCVHQIWQKHTPFFVCPCASSKDFLWALLRYSRTSLISK
jgi:hypothetical protein